MATAVLAQLGYLVRDSLAEELGVKPDTLLRWENDGMPSIKYGQVVVYEAAEVIKWMKKNNKKRA